MYVLLRHLALFQDAVPHAFLQWLLLGFGLFSIVVALPFILVQHDVKRLLAYSSVENMGIILVGVGIWTPLAMYGALLHLINHALIKSALFYLSGVIAQRYHTKDILRIRGLVRLMPLTGSLFLLLLLTITGVPPMGIFISKLTIIWAAFQSGDRLLGVSLLLLLAGVCAGLLYYCWQICFSVQPRQAVPSEAERVVLAAAGISFSVVLFLGLVMPVWLGEMLHQAVLMVMGG